MVTDTTNINAIERITIATTQYRVLPVIQYIRFNMCAINIQKKSITAVRHIICSTVIYVLLGGDFMKQIFDFISKNWYYVFSLLIATIALILSIVSIIRTRYKMYFEIVNKLPYNDLTFNLKTCNCSPTPTSILSITVIIGNHYYSAQQITYISSIGVEHDFSYINLQSGECTIIRCKFNVSQKNLNAFTLKIKTSHKTYTLHINEYDKMQLTPLQAILN